MKIAFYYVDDKYIEYLKAYEKEKRGFTCVPNVTYSNRGKFTYGSVLEINNINYYVPVSSKTNKNPDNNILIKTDDKKNPVKGSLRFQYMIPVPAQCLHICKMEDFPNDNYRTKVSKELAFCRRNRDKIFKQAEKTYDRVIKGASEKLTKNSCDFKMLEAACLEYMDIELNGHEGIGD